jgi:uncharacterized damage-inducible protein DinB
MTNALLVAMFETKAWADRGLYDALLAIPDDSGADPVEMFRIRALMDHMTVVDRLFRARIAGEPEPFAGIISPVTPSFAELRGIAAETDDWLLDYARRAMPAELEEVIAFTFTDGDPGLMTRGEMLGHILTHDAAHRGAIGFSLGRMKLKGGPDTLTSYLSWKRGSSTA